MPKWEDIPYLLGGTARQQAAYHTLQTLGVLDELRQYKPILVGTIPIDLDIDGSDLDIDCEAHDLDSFERHLRKVYVSYPGFRLRRRVINDVAAVVASFQYDPFPIEIFGQAVAVRQQNAYRHMVIEWRLLALGGKAARRDIRALKRGGLKTEAAFAHYFGLDGDPYEALFELETLDEAALRARIASG